MGEEKKSNKIAMKVFIQKKDKDGMIFATIEYCGHVGDEQEINDSLEKLSF